MASEEDLSYNSDEELTQVQYQPRISDASPRPRSARAQGKSSAPSRPGSSARGTPYAGRSSSGRKSTGSLSRSAGSKTGTKKDIQGHKTPQQYYTETLRRTGVGFSDSNKYDSFSGLSKTQTSNMSYNSTSHYLRQKVGVEKPGKRATRPNSAGRPAGGGPSYKSQEEYYDDIIELKKQIQALTQDNSVMKSRVRRLEEDNAKKEKEIGQLLDPSKSEEMRRTLADRKPDAGTVIHSMKQKILKLEQQLKEKEAAYNKLQSDMKTTKVEELKVQMEAFYNEVLRLQKVKTIEAPTYRNSGQSSREPKESSAKLKALKDTIQKTNEANYKLRQENQSLKEDLDKLLQREEKRKDDEAKHGDKNKKELLSTISKLEKRLDKAEETTSLMSDIETRSSNIEGKIKLEGSAAQRIDQLDRRETELLEELNKMQTTNRKLKEDRAHYRKKVDEKDKEIKRLKAELEEVHAELDGFYEKDKNRVTPRAATPRKDNRVKKRTPYDKEEVENFRRKHAAKTIQSRWRTHKHEMDEREDDEAAEMIQSYLRAHSSRKQHLKKGRRGRIDDDDDDVSIGRASKRSSRRSHVKDSETGSNVSDDDSLADVYRNQLSNANLTNSFRLNTSSRSKHSDDDTEQTHTETDTDVPMSSSMKKRESGRFTSVSASRSLSPTSRLSSSSGRAPPKRNNDVSDDDDDDDSDDDLIVTSGRK